MFILYLLPNYSSCIISLCLILLSFSSFIFFYNFSILFSFPLSCLIFFHSSLLSVLFLFLLPFSSHHFLLLSLPCLAPVSHSSLVISLPSHFSIIFSYHFSLLFPLFSVSVFSIPLLFISFLFLILQ